MFDLRTLQEDFLTSYQGSTAFEKYIKLNKLSSSNRLLIYHRNIRQSLLRGLKSIYPLTWKLIGKACADEAAATFFSKIISSSVKKIDDELESQFPLFLKSYLPTQGLAYLPDFAALEWKSHLAYGAEDRIPLAAHDFVDIPQEKYPALILKLHPSVYLFSSKYPLDQVLLIVQDEVDVIDLENRGSNALIVRQAQVTNIHWVSEVQFMFFSLLQEEIPLMELLEQIDDKNFHFHQALSFSLQNGLFSDYRLAL